MIDFPGKKRLVSLRKKRNRYAENMFVAEGEKIVGELLLSKEVVPVIVYIREDKWVEKFDENKLFVRVNEKKFRQISTLETSQGWLGVFKMPNYVTKPMQLTFPVLVFDSIRDPGNLGTIIRTADWFGIDTIVCSKDSVDVFSPKVVQSSMGAVVRVKVYYTDLEVFFKSRSEVPLYAFTMNGNNVFNFKIPEQSFLLFGNESRGISEKLLTFATKKITIPNFSKKRNKIESLNVAVSASIVMALSKK